jgi:hypothetical protein
MQLSLNNQTLFPERAQGINSTAGNQTMPEN